MGEEWPEEGALDAKGRIIAAPFPKEHAAVPLRFLSIDVQMDHFWLVVRSWSAEGASRLLWCQKALTWEELEAVQARFRIHDNLVFVDAGYNSYEVYRQCARHGWTALMGDAHSTFAHKSPQGTVQRFYSPVRRIAVSRGLVCRMHYWSNLQIKDVLARLRREHSRDGQPMWQVPDDVPEDYCMQMESEHRIRKNNKWIWEQIGNRPNHLFDAEAIQVVAAVMLKMVGREAVSGIALTGEPEGDPGTTRSKEPPPARMAKTKTPDRP